MKKVIFLNANEFANIASEAKRFEAGFGTGRNVSAVKKTANGNYFLKLSPIADPIYNWTSQYINPVTEKEIERVLRAGTRWF